MPGATPADWMTGEMMQPTHMLEAKALRESCTGSLTRF